jgi:predicted dienelactone hydrolase
MKTYGEFPAPIGEYKVGRTQMDFRYIASDNSEREVTAYFFYPADSAEGRPASIYAFPELHALRDELMAKIGSPSEKIFDDGFSAGCYDGPPLSEKEKDFPVLIYNHGAGTFPQQGTLFCRDLASAGYIAVSIGHPGSGIQKLTNGRIVAFTEEFMDDLAEYGKEAATLIMTMPQIIAEKQDREKAIEISRSLTAAPEATKFAKYAELQSEDVRYIADCLYKMNTGDIPSIFTGRLRLEIGLGVFGHSFGGTTAAITCRDDERFVCGVNFDGNMLGCLDSDLGKPFMHLCTPLAWNTNAFLLESNSGENYFAVIEGVHHYEFSDCLFTGEKETRIGSRNPMEVRDIIITYTKAFFDKYLLADETDTGSLAFDGVELIME